MMRWFTVVAPPITPEALFGEHDAEGGGHSDHQAYTEESLRRAITEGIDPAGNRLDDAMPRWFMSEQDLTDLIKYLQGTKERE